jgi:hypothetical protein
VSRREFRLGTEDVFDLQNPDGGIGLYGGRRYVY